MKAPKESKKTKQISADLNVEDCELLEKVMADNKLSSKREGFAFIFKRYAQSLNPNAVIEEKTADVVCKYLSKDGVLCCRDEEKIVKTKPSQCAACKQAEKLAVEDEKLRWLNHCDDVKNYFLAVKLWEKLTGQIDLHDDKFLGLTKINLKIVGLNSEIENLKEVIAKGCPKCGFKIPLDEEEADGT